MKLKSAISISLYCDSFAMKVGLHGCNHTRNTTRGFCIDAQRRVARCLICSCTFAHRALLRPSVNARFKGQ